MSYTLQYRPFIENLTRRIHERFGQRYSYEDMLSEALLASVAAEKRYDPERSDYSSFIRRTLEGAIIRSVTSTTSKQQSLLLKVYRWVDEYAGTHDAIPSIGMALEALDITKASYEKALEASDHLYRIPMEDVGGIEVPSEDLEELYDAVERLPTKYRLQAQQYLEGKPCDSRALKTIVKRLKEIMGEK